MLKLAEPHGVATQEGRRAERSDAHEPRVERKPSQAIAKIFGDGRPEDGANWREQSEDCFLVCRLSLSISFLCVRTYELLAYGRKGRGMRAFCHASSTDRPPLAMYLTFVSYARKFVS